MADVLIQSPPQVAFPLPLVTQAGPYLPAETSNMLPIVQPPAQTYAATVEAPQRGNEYPYAEPPAQTYLGTTYVKTL